MPRGLVLPWGREYSVIVPEVVIFAILLLVSSVNQRFPSDPATMSYGLLLPVGREYSVTVPVGAILAILLALFSTNHSLPSGPSVILTGALLAVVMLYSVMPESTDRSWRCSSPSPQGMYERLRGRMPKRNGFSARRRKR